MKKGTYQVTVKCSKCKEPLTIDKASGDRYGLTLELEMCEQCEICTHQSGLDEGKEDRT